MQQKKKGPQLSTSSKTRREHKVNHRWEQDKKISYAVICSSCKTIRIPIEKRPGFKRRFKTHAYVYSRAGRFRYSNDGEGFGPGSSFKLKHNHCYVPYRDDEDDF
jgi:hypothetical protein